LRHICRIAGCVGANLGCCRMSSASENGGVMEADEIRIVADLADDHGFAEVAAWMRGQVCDKCNKLHWGFMNFESPICVCAISSPLMMGSGSLMDTDREYLPGSGNLTDLTYEHRPPWETGELDN
jgi:hypothetical protein